VCYIVNNINFFYHQYYIINCLYDNTIIFPETILLEKTPAFAIDYLFAQVSNPYQHNCDEDMENYIFV